MYADNYKRSTERMQPINSSLCGYYCLYYAYFKCKNYDMDIILDKMNHGGGDHVYNYVINKFCICEDSNCILLQRCKCL